MKAWNDYFYGPVAAIRPYLFGKCFLLVVATDALVLMAERGSRYGIDGFNVAHFAWLDRVHPLPTATWYVGILMLVSLLAYTIVFLGPSRVLLAALALLYTYSWAMSRHDSYLHHYMISLILACMVCFPPITYADLLPVYRRGVGILFSRRAVGNGLRAVPGTPQRALPTVARPARKETAGALAPLTCAWGFRLLGATVGVIYIYTSAAKADAQWCGGHTLQQVGDAPQVFGPLVRLAAQLGVSPEWFWSIAATMVIPLELTIAVSYFLAVRQDEPGRKWLPRWCVVAWLLATGLHANNEMIDLSIQWFSYYMMFLAAFFFLPQPILLALGACVVLPAHGWQSRVVAPLLKRDARTQLAWGVAATAIAAAILYAAGRYIGLPGALWALPLAAAICVLYAAAKNITVGCSSREQPEPSHMNDAPAHYSQVGAELASSSGRRLASDVQPFAVAAAVAIAGLVMVGVTSVSSMRFDYYANLGKEYQQNLTALFSDAHARALAAYEIAERYGPPDQQQELELMINMGLAHSRMDDFPAAHQRYRRALEIDPNSYHALFNQGVAYQVAGDLVRAEECFERATEIRTDFGFAYRELGRVQEHQGKLTKALVNLRTAARLLPDDPNIQPDIARVLAATSHDSPPQEQHAKSDMKTD
jgi:tetratricopeptide (TPR) repeat protein